MKWMKPTFFSVCINEVSNHLSKTIHLFQMHTIEEYSEILEHALSDFQYPGVAPRLYTPVKYTLEGGGKRLRPVLLMAAAEAFGTSPEAVLAQAMGIEMFHNFTLLHDDVMDNADVRRGRSTVHRRWNASAAILSGDAMLTMASQLMGKTTPGKLPAVLDLFNTTAMEIYQGQQLDMEFEDRTDVSVDEYIEMIRLKTSVLLACACAMGVMLAGADAPAVEAMYAYGERLGLAFQLQDDYLDTYSDPALFGKEIGGDIINEKKTWLWINATAERSEQLQRIVERKPTHYLKIEQVRAIYDELELPRRSHELIDRYIGEAVDALERAGLSAESRRFFESIALGSASRTH